MSNLRLRSASVPSTSALSRALPRLSMARSWDPEPRSPRGARRELGERVEERPDVDRALLDRRPGRVLARTRPQAVGHDAGRRRGGARRPEDELGGALGAGEQRDDRGIGGRPAGGVTEDVERELVDDAAGVPDPDLAGGLLARLDRQGRRDQRDGCSHGRECSRASGPGTGAGVRIGIVRSSYPGGGSGASSCANPGRRGRPIGHVGLPVKSTLTGRTAGPATVGRTSTPAAPCGVPGGPGSVAGRSTHGRRTDAPEGPDPGRGPGVRPPVEGRDRQPAAPGAGVRGGRRRGAARGLGGAGRRGRGHARGASPRCARCGGAASAGSCCSCRASTTGRSSRPPRPA